MPSTGANGAQLAPAIRIAAGSYASAKPASTTTLWRDQEASDAGVVGRVVSANGDQPLAGREVVDANGERFS